MKKPLMCPESLLEQDLNGRRYIVTGANSGIGFVTAAQLAKQGAHVVLACRSNEQGEKAQRAIVNEHPGASVAVELLDLSSLDSVRSFAGRFLEKYDRLDALVNNAGVMNTPALETKDGFEMQFGVNHLGHFLLTQLLVDVLERSAPSRVVNVSSCFHDRAMGRDGDIVFDDLHFKQRKYDGWEAYAQSKLANLLHAQELARRLQGSGVTSVSVHPGWVRTNLIRNSMPPWVQNYLLRPALRLWGMIEPWEGAQSTLYALLSPDIEQHPGEFFSQLGVYRDKRANGGGWPLESPNPNAHDREKAKRLWEVSEKLVAA